jgi:hypothetical protein
LEGGKWGGGTRGQRVRSTFLCVSPPWWQKEAAAKCWLGTIILKIVGETVRSVSDRSSILNRDKNNSQVCPDIENYTELENNGNQRETEGKDGGRGMILGGDSIMLWGYTVL